MPGVRWIPNGHRVLETASDRPCFREDRRIHMQGIAVEEPVTPVQGCHLGMNRGAMADTSSHKDAETGTRNRAMRRRGREEGACTAG